MRISAGGNGFPARTDACGKRSRPSVVVLCDQDEPTGMQAVHEVADIRYVQAKELAQTLPGADVLFVWHFLSDAVRSSYPAADRLSWVHTASAGVDRLLFDELVRSDVTLTNSRGVFDSSIAEFVLGTILAFAKDLPGNWRLQRDIRWQHRETERISDKTVAISGTGPIGRATARLLRAAGMHVFGLGRTARADDPDFGIVYADTQLHDKLVDADYVVAVAPLTAQTKGMFDARAFAAMKSTARLINVGRGALVIEDDLMVALQDGQLAGAALDVFDVEPLPVESALWKRDDVLISAHMSGDFVGWKSALAEIFVAQFADWYSGAPMRNVVDKSLGYVPGTPEPRK